MDIDEFSGSKNKPIYRLTKNSSLKLDYLKKKEKQDLDYLVEYFENKL
jgi:hypothetical protein